MLSQVNTWATLDCGCTDFSCVLKPKIEKMGTLEKKWGPNGDTKSEKGPHGDPGTQIRHTGRDKTSTYHLSPMFRVNVARGPMTSLASTFSHSSLPFHLLVIPGASEMVHGLI